MKITSDINCAQSGKTWSTIAVNPIKTNKPPIKIIVFDKVPFETNFGWLASKSLIESKTSSLIKLLSIQILRLNAQVKQNYMVKLFIAGKKKDMVL